MPYNIENVLATLEALQWPTLPDESRDFLDAPFSEEEVVSTIRLFPNCKAPGLDGMPIEWYRMYLEALVPRLLNFYLDCFQKESGPSSFYEAHIVLLAKPDKDPHIDLYHY